MMMFGFWRSVCETMRGAVELSFLLRCDVACIFMSFDSFSENKEAAPPDFHMKPQTDFLPELQRPEPELGMEGSRQSLWI